MDPSLHLCRKLAAKFGAQPPSSTVFFCLGGRLSRDSRSLRVVGSVVGKQHECAGEEACTLRVKPIAAGSTGRRHSHGERHERGNKPGSLIDFDANVKVSSFRRTTYAHKDHPAFERTRAESMLPFSIDQGRILNRTSRRQFMGWRSQ